MHEQLMKAYHLVLGFGIDKLLTEDLPVAIFTRLFNNNLLEVVRESVDDELELLVKLELVEDIYALRRDLYSIP